MGTEGLSQAYLRLIHDIATRLSRDDCKNLLYLSGLSAQSLPSSFNGCGSSHRCCTSICGPLDLLTHMQSEGLFSECNLTPLVSLLQDLGRNDLASKCSLLKDASLKIKPDLGRVPCIPGIWKCQLILENLVVNSFLLQLKEYGVTKTSHMKTTHESSEPELDASEEATCTSTCPSSSSSHQTEDPVHIRLCRCGHFLNKFKSKVFIHLPLQSSSKRTSSEADISSFHIIDLPSPSSPSSSSPSPPTSSPPAISPLSTTSLTTFSSHSPTSFTTPDGWLNITPSVTTSLSLSSTGHCRGATSVNRPGFRGRSWTAPLHHITSPFRSHPRSRSSTSAELLQEESEAVKRLLALPLPPCYVWRVKLSELLPAITKRDKKPLVRKFHVRSSAKEDNLSLQLTLYLHPNGIDWDQDTFCTLRVEMSREGRQAITNHKLCFMVLGVEGGGRGEVVVKREKVCALEEEEEDKVGRQVFILREFLAHEVLKSLSARFLELQFSLQLQYTLGSGVEDSWVYIGRDHAL